MVYHWLINSLHSWLPQACCLCGQSSHPHAICPACQHDLPRFDAKSCCRQCGRPTTMASGGPCGHCLRQPPAYDAVIAGYGYADPIAQLVSKLKFRGQIQLARLFGELLAERVADSANQIQAILPVPLHPRRLRQRGFNQALEIARSLARQHGLPILRHGLYRQRDTLPQSSQVRDQRRQNVRGAFCLNRLPALDSIAIVDDVMTSGHTVNEIAKLCRRAGIRRIEVWCVARAWPHPH
ncbi:MAG: ComF family protein [Gammaproteobacteria bacterium]|jgi:ComF family protein